MHNRVHVKQLNYFHKKILNVARNPVKEQRLRQGNSIYTSSEYNWVELTEVRHVVDALINYGIAKRKRILMICDHYDCVAQAKVDMAVSRLPICDYLLQERILKMILTEEGLSQSPSVLSGVSSL